MNPKTPVNSSIIVPTYQAPIPPDAINAPDAPMVDTPQAAPNVNSVVPQAVPTTQDFLASVREVNEKRQSKLNDNAPVQEPEKSKADITPKVFKDNADVVPQEPVEDVEESDDFVDPADVDPATPPLKAKSIKELKNHIKGLKNKETQLKTRTQELEAEVQRLSAFQEKMEEFEQLKQRNKELETYEQIFDIHNNPEFHEKYVAGFNNTLTEAKNIAAQYKVDGHVVDEALKITNRLDLNNHLKKSGLDEYGVQEVRQYVLHLQALDQERLQLEKYPQEARETLSKLYRDNETRRIETVSKLAKDRSLNAWNQILAHYSRGETAVDLLKDKPGDPEHTERRMIVNKRAQNEFIKFMGSLVGLGAKDIPPALAHTAAARFQLSEWFGEINAENKVLKEELKDVKAQLSEATKYTRPSFNGSSGNSPQAPAAIKSGDIAGHVMSKAMQEVNNRPQR